MTLLVMLFSTFSLNAFAKNISDFQYEITPDSPEWKKFEPRELKNMLNIPAMDRMMDAAYPNAIRLRSSTYRYN